MADITLDMLKSWVPCYNYRMGNYYRVREIVGDRESMTHHEVTELDIPIEDKFWVLTHLLTPKNQRLLACEIAESVLAGREPHPNLCHAIEVSRRYANGQATYDELKIAETPAWRIWSSALTSVKTPLSGVALSVADDNAWLALWRTAAIANVYRTSLKEYLSLAVQYIDKQENEV